MLILTRKVGRSVDVENATVTILGIDGGRVRFGFDLPDDTMVYRSELTDDMRAALVAQLKEQNALGLTTEDGLLVLSRTEGESFVIGDSIRLSLLKVSGSKVRIGIDAPPEARILRSELSQQKAVA